LSKKTLDQIVKSKNEYLVKVKRNQKKLLQEMEQICDSRKCLDSSITKEKNRGRKEQRTVKTYKVSDYIKMNWPKAQTLVYVKRQRIIKRRKAVSYSYYLSSISVKAKEFAIGIRHHWGIENRLHYVKDVTLKEDKSKIRSGNAPAILSLIRNLVINIARCNGENRIKKYMRQCSGNIELTISLLE
jgi:predicted transposase YbfD/YdcC